MSLLTCLARKIPFKMRDRPSPTGRTTPSQKWNLYDRSTLPSSALESRDCAARVGMTIQIGRLRPATKKFSALPLTKKMVRRPIRQEMPAKTATAMPYPMRWK